MSKSSTSYLLYSLCVTAPRMWDYGTFVLGCGTFGGIGGSERLVGQGLDECSAFATMDEAVRLGIRLFDTAESYAGGASETMIGRWFAERGSTVTELVRITTKVAPPSPNTPGERFDGTFLEEKFSGSLARLGVDRVEFLLIHAPDESTSIEVTLEGLEAIRASGRCRYVGACNVNAAQITAALEAAERLNITGYQVVQNGFSLLRPKDDQAVRSICAERGLAFTPFSPLAGGALTGKYERGVKPPSDSRMALRPDGVDESLNARCVRCDRPAQRRSETATWSRMRSTCVAWLLHHRQVTSVVTGPARRSPHLKLAAMATDILLSDADFEQIESWFASAASVQ